MAERDPAREFAASPRRRGAHARDPRDGARGLPRQRRATAATSARPSCSTCSTPLAAERGLAHVATGTNADDAVAGFRPGIRAAAERGAITPLRDAGLTKAQIRAASRRWGLPTWDKPAAACLSSRIAYGVEVDAVPARPGRARGGRRAELLADAGLVNLRVRDLGDRASVEIDAAAAPARRRRSRPACSTPCARPASPRRRSTLADSVRDR